VAALSLPGPDDALARARNMMHVVVDTCSSHHRRHAPLSLLAHGVTCVHAPRMHGQHRESADSASIGGSSWAKDMAQGRTVPQHRGKVRHMDHRYRGWWALCSIAIPVRHGSQRGMFGCLGCLGYVNKSRQV
jgi:hypothetical protein